MDKPLGDTMAAKTQEGLWKSFLTTMLLQDTGLRIYPASCRANSSAEGNWQSEQETLGTQGP